MIYQNITYVSCTIVYVTMVIIYMYIGIIPIYVGIPIISWNTNYIYIYNGSIIPTIYK